VVLSVVLLWSNNIESKESEGIHSVETAEAAIEATTGPWINHKVGAAAVGDQK